MLSSFTWFCALCGQEFVDSENPPEDPTDLPSEAQLYWLGPTEVVCQSCAVETGIPKVDD